MVHIVLQHMVVITTLLVFVPHHVFGYITYTVPCDHTTPSCECPLYNENGTMIDVCEFELELTIRHTFTRYKVDTTINTLADRGQLWIIDPDTGEFQPHGVCDEPCCPNCTDPFAVDGYTYRTFIATNGRIPAPTLIVNHNQIVSANLINNLHDNVVSIHWHGLDQERTDFMDGVEHVTQCGATPDTSFRYIFEAANTGTFWYHSHTGGQRTDGLFGSLIIKENSTFIQEAKEIVGEFEDYPDQHTLLFLDWQLKTSTEILSKLVSTVRFYDNNQVPTASEMRYVDTNSQDGAKVGAVSYWSGLINGKGRHESVDYIQSRLSIFTVKPGEQYRFRLVGAQGLYAYRVSIAEHKLKVFALDGTLVKPMEVDFIIIQSGERYDFLLETKSMQEITDGNNSFPIWGRTLETSIPEAHVVEAILHYDTTPEPNSAEYEDIFMNSTDDDRCTTAEPCDALNCPFMSYPSTFNIKCMHVNELELLFPVEEDELPDAQVGEDDMIMLNFAFGGSGGTPSINGRNLVMPSSPLTVLNSSDLDDIEEREFCKNLNVSSECDSTDIVKPGCMCTHVIEIPYNHSIQMVFSAVGPNLNPNEAANTFSGSHPIHIHGHQFQVVDIQFGDYDDGMLIRGNDDISCGGTTVCTNPSWAVEKNYASGEGGKISSTAPRKDTIFLPAGGYVVVYFKSNNPGFWFLHCHIEIHQLQGMAAIINEAEEYHPQAPSGMDVCGNFFWTIDDFYETINANPQGKEEEEEEHDDDDDNDDDDNELALSLGVGLGIGLLLLLIINVILVMLLLFCCFFKRNPNGPRGA